MIKMDEKLTLVDSHCHLHHMDMAACSGGMDSVIHAAREHDVHALLSVCITLDDVPKLLQLACSYPEVKMSVGVHPNEALNDHVTEEQLVELGKSPYCVALGETGLDYYRIGSPTLLLVQRERFREHIRAARRLAKPLIIHTREAAEDTLKIMREERADEVGGVMHCFVESWDIARQALDLNFFISFSGVLTFKNAQQVHEVARKVPLDRILIETDSPYLAPVPFRGKPNQPAWVKYVARALAQLREQTELSVARETTANYHRCFPLASLDA